eukprot:2780219-Karenia_brevis.AAC.1
MSDLSFTVGRNAAFKTLLYWPTDAIAKGPGVRACVAQQEQWVARIVVEVERYEKYDHDPL